jgi:DNA-directed RNA polymerase specialized sigma24 family protein
MSKTISLQLEPAIAKAPNKGGRPRKEIDQHTFEGLCEIQCTLEEIAGVLRVSEDTVERWCERTYELGFADTFKKFSATGKTSLRRQQFELAKKGNATMLIWLGKQYLGQTDKPVADDSDEDLNPEEAAKQLYSMIREASVRYRASTSTQTTSHS